MGNEGTFYDPYAAQGGGDSGFVLEWARSQMHVQQNGKNVDLILYI